MFEESQLINLIIYKPSKNVLLTVLAEAPTQTEELQTLSWKSLSVLQSKFQILLQIPIPIAKQRACAPCVKEPRGSEGE